MSLKQLVSELPKAELHLHIEGTLEPELMLKLAKKNKVNLPYRNIDEVRQAYQFEDLQSFLNLYYLGASALKTEDDFYQLMWAYLVKCKEQNVVHTEIMFDPQTHTQRGIDFDVFMPGFERAITQAKTEWGQSVLLIMSFLRDLSEEEAIETLVAARPYLHMVEAVGLDSAELHNPPEKFADVFAQSRALGLRCVAHAGEEGPSDYIWSALQVLHVDRIDHGVRSEDDSELLAHLKGHQIPLTVCPLSNIKLCVFDHMKKHNIMRLLEQGLLVTINADDPSYFGGYLNENFEALIDNLPIEQKDVVQLVKNSFTASFLSEAKKRKWIRKIDEMTQVSV